jgi:CMP-N-acetylneuraminic acid synthetase
MLKIVAMIPYWSGYVFPEESLGQRDTLTLGGHALINYTVKVAANVEAIGDVIIYASDDKILDRIEDKRRCRYICRDKDLDAQGVSIESIIDRFLTVSDADIVVLMHPKNPFLRPTTVSTCIKMVVGGEYDSAFVATKARKFAWFNGQPLNYSSARDTPSLSCIEPVVLESSSVYVFSRKLFERTRHRIGSNPYIHETGHFEGFEVDHPDDYEIAELIVNAGLELSGV